VPKPRCHRQTLTPEEMQQISGGVGLPVLFGPVERPFPEADVFLIGLRTEKGEFRFVAFTPTGLPFLA
jgi:hypothetical protein